MAKVVCVLYDDPVDGYPKSYPRDDVPTIDHYPGGQTLPTPKSIDFKHPSWQRVRGTGLAQISRIPGPYSDRDLPDHGLEKEILARLRPSRFCELKQSVDK